MKKNEHRFREYLINNDFSERSSNNFYKLLEYIPNESRRILEMKWGLLPNKKCCSFTQLAKKMGVKKEEAESFHEQAIKELWNSQYAALLKVEDFNEIGFELAARFGMIAASITDTTNIGIQSPDSIPYRSLDLHELQSCMCELSIRESQIVCYRYGVAEIFTKEPPVGIRTIQEVESRFSYTQERVHQFLCNASRKLKVRKERFIS